MKSILTSWILRSIALGFTSSKRHVMDELILGDGSFDRGMRNALRDLVPCLALHFDDDLPTPTDVPVPKPFDVPVPTPIDVPPPEPRDIPQPEIEPKPKPRPLP